MLTHPAEESMHRFRPGQAPRALSFRYTSGPHRIRAAPSVQDVEKKTARLRTVPTRSVRACSRRGAGRLSPAPLARPNHDLAAEAPFDYPLSASTRSSEYSSWCARQRRVGLRR